MTGERIYPPGAPIEGAAEVSADAGFTGSLRVAAFDPRSSESEEGLVYDHTSPVEIAAPGGSVVLPFAFTPDHDAAYVIHASLSAAGEEVGRAVLEVGVRELPEGFPETILSAAFESIDVPGLRESLAAAGGEPVPIDLGRMVIEVEVEAVDLFAEGAAVPGELEEVATYRGGVAGEPGSLVALTVGRESLHGMVALSQEDVVWVEPLARFDPSAPLEVHAVYFGDEEDFPELEHAVDAIEPVPPGGPKGAPRPAAAGGGPGGAGGNHSQPVVVRLKVYEHRESSRRMKSRLALLTNWAAIMFREFQDITPAESTGHAVSVGRVVVESWEAIGRAGYTGTCQEVLNRFRCERNGESNRLYVLFSDEGSGCGGMGYLGSGRYTSFHSLARDEYSEQTNLVVLGQEVGHNLDWHPTWPDWQNNNPHDPHLDVSEEWNHEACLFFLCWHKDHEHCTIMRASYAGCEEAEARYSRNQTEALEHLASGLGRYFNQEPNAVCGSASAAVGDTRADVLLDIPGFGGVRDTGDPARDRELEVYAYGSTVEWSIQTGRDGGSYSQGEVSPGGTTAVAFPHHTSFLMTIYRGTLDRIGWIFGRENDNQLPVVFLARGYRGSGDGVITHATANLADSTVDTLMEIPRLGGVRDTGDPAQNRNLEIYSNSIFVVEWSLQHGNTYTHGEVSAGGSAVVTFPHNTAFLLNIARPLVRRTGWLLCRENLDSLNAQGLASAQECGVAWPGLIGARRVYVSDSVQDTLLDIPTTGGVRDTGDPARNRELVVYSNGSAVDYTIQYGRSGGTFSQGVVPANGSVSIAFPHHTSFIVTVGGLGRQGWLFCRENDDYLVSVYSVTPW